MGIHEWSYDNDISLDLRFKVPHRTSRIALKDIKVEVELGFDRKLAFAEAQRCLNCDVQTVFTDQLCIECDACVDICPMDCITFTANGEEAELRTRLQRAGAQPARRTLRLRRAEDRPHHGQGRGRVPALRPVRRALPDRRLGHAEIPARIDAGRRPDARMLQPADRTREPGSSAYNDFVVKFANVNGSGSASRQRAVRRGDPAHGRAGQPAQHLPLQHPGPADLVRGAGLGGGLPRARAAAWT